MISLQVKTPSCFYDTKLLWAGLDPDCAITSPTLLKGNRPGLSAIPPDYLSESYVRFC